MKYSHLKALLVDDDEVMQLVVETKLKTVGIQSVTANTGSDAIIELGAHKFDFIVMDISMPGQDGIDSVKWIRDLLDEEKRNIPIFALTSFSTKSHSDEILSAGFNEHLVKPLQLEQLLKLLDKYFWKTIS